MQIIIKKNCNHNNKCDHCEKFFKTKQGLSVDVVQKHQEQMKPEVLSDEGMNKSSDISMASEERKERTYICDICYL